MMLVLLKNIIVESVDNDILCWMDSPVFNFIIFKLMCSIFLPKSQEFLLPSDRDSGARDVLLEDPTIEPKRCPCATFD